MRHTSVMTKTQTPSKTFYIPARKEAATISKVVRSLIWAADRSKIGLDSISVVDEGSTDNTAAVAAEADARVVSTSDLSAEFGGSRGCIVTTVSGTQSTDPNHIAADLHSPESATAVIDEVTAKNGALNIEINAMGVVAFGEISTKSVDTVEEVSLTKTFGHIFSIQAALRKISRGAAAVGISGVIAEQNYPGMVGVWRFESSGSLV